MEESKREREKKEKKNSNEKNFAQLLLTETGTDPTSCILQGQHRGGNFPSWNVLIMKNIDYIHLSFCRRFAGPRERRMTVFFDDSEKNPCLSIHHLWS